MRGSSLELQFGISNCDTFMCFLPTIVFFSCDNAKHLPAIVKTLQTSHSRSLLNMCYIIFSTKTIPFHKKCTNQIDSYNIISSLPQYF